LESADAVQAKKTKKLTGNRERNFAKYLLYLFLFSESEDAFIDSCAICNNCKKAWSRLLAGLAGLNPSFWRAKIRL